MSVSVTVFLDDMCICICGLSSRLPSPALGGLHPIHWRLNRRRRKNLLLFSSPTSWAGTYLLWPSDWDLHHQLPRFSGLQTWTKLHGQFSWVSPAYRYHGIMILQVLWGISAYTMDGVSQVLIINMDGWMDGWVGEWILPRDDNTSYWDHKLLLFIYISFLNFNQWIWTLLL